MRHRRLKGWNVVVLMALNNTRCKGYIIFTSLVHFNLNAKVTDKNV